MNFLKELKTKPEIQRQAFFARANQMIKKIDVKTGGNAGPAAEYFCFDCKQLRLSLIADKTKCVGCGSENIITGKCGELDKQKLLEQANAKENASI